MTGHAMAMYVLLQKICKFHSMQNGISLSFHLEESLSVSWPSLSSVTAQPSVLLSHTRRDWACSASPEGSLMPPVGIPV